MPALSVDVLARFDGFSKALGSMAGDASKVAGELSRSFGGIARTFGLLGGVSIGAGSLAILKSTVTELAALNDGANRAGISVEQLSSRINTLSPTGVGLEQLLDLYAKLTKSALAADNATSRQAEAFRQLGVKTRDALGNMRNADELVDDVAKALSRFADDGNKAAYAQAFFEESGQRLLPILTDIASKQREAASVTKEQAQAADDLADKLGEVGRNVDVVRQRIVADPDARSTGVDVRHGGPQLGVVFAIAGCCRQGQGARTDRRKCARATRICSRRVSAADEVPR